LTTEDEIFAILTYLEKLSRRSQSFAQKHFLQESVNYSATIQPPEAQSI